jgi:hypothetical protein
LTWTVPATGFADRVGTAGKGGSGELHALERCRFDGTIYDRGAMTLQALREKVGNRTFFRFQVWLYQPEKPTSW